MGFKITKKGLAITAVLILCCLLVFGIPAIMVMNMGFKNKSGVSEVKVNRNDRNFFHNVFTENGCDYVYIQSMDGLAITPSLSQPATCIQNLK